MFPFMAQVTFKLHLKLVTYRWKEFPQPKPRDHQEEHTLNLYPAYVAGCFIYISRVVEEVSIHFTEAKVPHVRNTPLQVKVLHSAVCLKVQKYYQ